MLSGYTGFNTAIPFGEKCPQLEELSVDIQSLLTSLCSTLLYIEEVETVMFIDHSHLSIALSDRGCNDGVLL